MIKKSKIGSAFVFLLMGVLSYYLIINKLIDYQAWDTFLGFLDTTPSRLALFISAQLVLWAANLVCETVKWHQLVQSTHKQNLHLSFRQTMGGFAWANLTPARLGEPVGKMTSLPSKSKAHALALSVFGSILQNAIIMVIAIPFAVVAFNMPNTPKTITHIMGNHHTFIAAALFLAGALVVVAGFKPFAQWFVRRYKMHRVLIGLTPKQISIAVIATICRYFCFSMQMVLALIFFDTQLGIMGVLALVPIYYFAITLVPSFILPDLGIKGSVALFIFGSLTPNAPAIVAAIFFIWALNTALPTLMGVLITVRPHKK